MKTVPGVVVVLAVACAVLGGYCLAQCGEITQERIDREEKRLELLLEDLKTQQDEYASRIVAPRTGYIPNNPYDTPVIRLEKSLQLLRDNPEQYFHDQQAERYREKRFMFPGAGD